MTIPYLFIDFDNTLMSTERLVLPSLIARFNQLYGHQISHPLTLDLFFQHFHGLARESLCQALSQYFAIHVEGSALYAGREEKMTQVFQENGVEMAKDVVDSLALLRHHGYRLALVTNSPLQRIFTAMRYARNGQGSALAQCFETEFFEAIPTPKPDPWVYTHALQQTGSTKNYAFAIEDSVTGLKAALGAGLPTLGFLGLARDPDLLERELSVQGAIQCFRTWKEIVHFLICAFPR